MFYIRLKESKEKKNILNSLISLFKFQKLDISEENIITLKDLSKKSLDRLSKFLKVNCISTVCLSNNLMIEEKFLNFLKSRECKIFNWKMDI